MSPKIRALGSTATILVLSLVAADLMLRLADFRVLRRDASERSLAYEYDAELGWKKLRLVILDACRDNPFSKTMRRTVALRGIGRGLAKVEPNNPNTLIAYSAKAGSTAQDGDGKDSLFTIALSRYLTTPGHDVRKAFGFVRDDVIKSTANKQEPFVYGSLGGDDVPLVPAPPSAHQLPPPPIRRPISGATMSSRCRSATSPPSTPSSAKGR